MSKLYLAGNSPLKIKSQLRKLWGQIKNVVRTGAIGIIVNLLISLEAG